MAQDLPNANYIPPSPTAAAFNRYGDIPVDIATGVPNISIPIFTIQEGGMKVPISISYHASGIKVRDIASEVGLGWVLNAGGVITQTALGKLDQQPASAANPTNYYNLHIMDSVVGLSNTNDIENNSDYIYNQFSQPSPAFDFFSDRYYYSLATGESGVFRKLFMTDSFLTIPYTPTQINFTNNTYTELELTPSDGTHHFFNMSYLDLFRLSKVVSADGDDSIMFYSHAVRYVDITYYDVAKFGDPVTVDGQTEYMDYIDQVLENQTNCPLMEVGTQNYGISLAKNRPENDGDFVVVDSIVSAGTRIVFNYASDRQDYTFDGTLPRLYQILVYDKLSGALINSINLSQSYFGAGGDNTAARMRLDSLQIGNNKEQKYKFAYNNNVQLPGYPEASGLSFSEDFWGYFNGAQGETLIPDAFCQRGMNRMPNESYAMADIIQEIDYPTGGKTLFTFEGNRVDPAVYNFTPTGAYGENIPTDGLVGGLRLKQMLTYADNTSAPIIKTYSYGYDNYSWLGQISPQTFTYLETDYNAFSDGCIDGSALIYTYANVAVSSPFYPLIGMSGSPIIYSRVTEYIGDSLNNVGKTIYYYNPYPEDLDAYAQPNFRSFYQYDHGTYVPELYKKEEYRNIAGTYSLVRVTNNSFDTYRSRMFQTGFSLGNDVTPVPIGPTDNQETAFDAYNETDEYLHTLEFSESYGYQDKDLVTETDVTEYGDAGNTITTKTFHDYDNYLQQINQSTITSKGDTLEQITSFPEQQATGNPASPNIYDTMVAKNIIDEPVVVTTFKNSNFLQSLTTNFSSWPGNLIAPNAVVSKVGTAPPDTRLTYDAYDTKPNVLSTTKGSMTTSYIWDYEHNYPIAKVVNAGHNDIGYTSFEADGTGNWTVGGTLRLLGGITGTQYYSLNSDISRSGLNSSASYVVSYWSFSGAYTVPGTIAGYPIKGKTISVGGIAWTYYEHLVAGQSTIQLEGSGGIDELRLYPAAAQMTTYTYAPLVGMTGQCDVANRVSYYFYDDLGRLSYVKDQDGNIIKTYQYHFKGQ